MFTKTIMYLSAFLPMYAIMFIKEIISLYLRLSNGEVIFKIEIIILSIELLLIITIVLLYFFLMINIKKLGTSRVKVNKIANKTSEYYLGYYSVFLLSLMNFSLLDVSDIVTMLLLTIVLGIVYIRNNLFYINPTINIIRSLIYEIEIDNAKLIVISNIIIKENDTIEIYDSKYDFTFTK